MEWLIGIIFLAIVFKLFKLVLTKTVPKSKHEEENRNASFTITLSSSGYLEQSENKPDDFKWVPHGKEVSIAGYHIPDGMIYYGKYMKSASSMFMVEPAFINETLPVKNSNPDYEGKHLHYWPSYSEIPPTSKAAYLEWLAGGRKKTDINIGYVFIFFYGLERRLLYDSIRQRVNSEEVQCLLNEIKRLLNIYGPMSGSFNHYAQALLEYMQLQQGQRKFYNFEPPISQYTYEISPIIKLALGQLAKEEKPLSAKWIYEYVIHHPEIYLRTPAKRCLEEFKQLFMIRYRQKFDEGIRIKGSKTKITINYHPASAGLRGVSLTNKLDIPDVTALKSLMNNVKPLVEQCQDELDSYSRWLGRNEGKKDSLTAFSLLPEELTDVCMNKEVGDFKNWLYEIIYDNDPVIIDNKFLFEKWPSQKDDKMNKTESLLFISLLEKIGVGIEPDVRFDGASLKLPGVSALFKFKEKPVTEPSAIYSGKLLLMQLAAAVAKADGIVVDSERSLLLNFIENSHKLSPTERMRMKAHIMWFLSTDNAIQSLKKRVEFISEKGKRDIADYLVLVAGADGYIDPEEVKMLTKLFKLLDLDEKEVYSAIHIFQVDNKKASVEEPITVIPADNRKSGYAIPGPPGKQGFKLDKEKIMKKMEETERVSGLLKDVFQEDEVEEPDIILEEDDNAEESVHGLDMNHCELLAAFKKQKVWPRSDFEKLSAKFDLLPNGAIDVLNEKALEICDEELCEGDDPIEINQDVLEALTS